MTPRTSNRNLLARVVRRYPVAADYLVELEATRAEEGMHFTYLWRRTRSWRTSPPDDQSWAATLADQLAALTADQDFSPEDLDQLLLLAGQGALTKGGHSRQILGLAAEHLLYTLLYPSGEAVSVAQQQLLDDPPDDVPAAEALAWIYSTVANPSCATEHRSRVVRRLQMRAAEGSLADTPWRWGGRPVWSGANARDFAQSVFDYIFTVYLYCPILSTGTLLVDHGLLRAWTTLGSQAAWTSLV